MCSTASSSLRYRLSSIVRSPGESPPSFRASGLFKKLSRRPSGRSPWKYSHFRRTRMARSRSSRVGDEAGLIRWGFAFGICFTASSSLGYLLSSKVRSLGESRPSIRTSGRFRNFARRCPESSPWRYSHFRRTRTSSKFSKLSIDTGAPNYERGLLHGSMTLWSWHSPRGWLL